MSTTKKATTPTSTSRGEAGAPIRLPLETEIYILPDGRVYFADLPAELACLVAALGETEQDLAR